MRKRILQQQYLEHTCSINTQNTMFSLTASACTRLPFATTLRPDACRPPVSPAVPSLLQQPEVSCQSRGPIPSLLSAQGPRAPATHPGWKSSDCISYPPTLPAPARSPGPPCCWGGDVPGSLCAECVLPLRPGTLFSLTLWTPLFQNERPPPISPVHASLLKWSPSERTSPAPL